jgi:hypothetical protein
MCGWKKAYSFDIALEDPACFGSRSEKRSNLVITTMHMAGFMEFADVISARGSET